MAELDESKAPSAEKPAPSRAARISGIVLGGISLFLWLVVTVMMSDIGRSDPAGNAMAAGFAGLGIIVLWGLLTILTFIAASKGTMPQWARLAIILVPASGFAAMGAVELLARTRGSSLAPLLVPLFIPPIVVAFNLLALLRTTMTGPMAGLFLGAVALTSGAVVPMFAERDRTVAKQQKASTDQSSALANLPADAALSQFLPYLKAQDQRIVSRARERIRDLPRRQSDAEAMLARGELSLAEMSAFLDYTPAVCESARARLRTLAESMVPPTPGAKPYSLIEPEVRAAWGAMSWLVGYGCAVNAESLAWETMAKAYRDPDYHVRWLADLREPNLLGRRLREDPAKFSQLDAQSHVKAWLKFADDASLNEQIIAGIRASPRRTADTIEILTDHAQESGRFRLIRILPKIDLETTPALCAAAAKETGGKLKGQYRPKGNDEPRPYSDLIDRLGIGRPLTALVWLGEHGCDVGAEARDAHELVSAWQDSPVMPWQDSSPGRSAMLAALAKLMK